MINLGMVNPGKTIYVPFQTYGSNNESITISGLATTDIEVYKDGGTTQRASDAGFTVLGTDFDGTTGLHGVSIDLSDNTTADFYEAGHDYMVAIASITVNSQTVNFWPVRFTVGYSGAILNTSINTIGSQTSFTLNEGSADDDAYKGCIVLVHEIASAVQVAFGVISDYTGSSKSVTLSADPGIFTMGSNDHVSIFPPGGLIGFNGARSSGDGSSGDKFDSVNT